jgi:cold shock CspA family protein
MPRTRYSGVVKTWFDEKGYGFVVLPEAPEREYFLHRKQIHKGLVPIGQLSSVSFSVIPPTRKFDNPSAVDVEVLS